MPLLKAKNCGPLWGDIYSGPPAHCCHLSPARKIIITRYFHFQPGLLCLVGWILSILASGKGRNRDDSGPERNSELAFLYAFFPHRKNGSNVLFGQWENPLSPSVWYVCSYESVFGSHSQVLVLRNLILVFPHFGIKRHLKVEAGWTEPHQLSGSGSGGLLATAAGAVGLCSKGECVTIRVPGQWRDGEAWREEVHCHVLLSFCMTSPLCRNSLCVAPPLLSTSLSLQNSQIRASIWVSLVG